MIAIAGYQVRVAEGSLHDDISSKECLDSLVCSSFEGTETRSMDWCYSPSMSLIRIEEQKKTTRIAPAAESPS